MSDIKKIEDQQKEMRQAGVLAPAPAPSSQRSATAVESTNSIKDPAAKFPLENAEQPADTPGQGSAPFPVDDGTATAPGQVSSSATAMLATAESESKEVISSTPTSSSTTSSSAGDSRHTSDEASDENTESFLTSGDGTANSSSTSLDAISNALSGLKDKQSWFVGSADARQAIREFQKVGRRSGYDGVVAHAINSPEFRTEIEMCVGEQGFKASDDVAKSAIKVTDIDEHPLGPAGDCDISTSLTVQLVPAADGMALSVRESLIIREQHVGPLRRSARIRAPPVRLELSANGVQLDEISVEHFSAELHHALESDVSDLSASVLEDNAEVDNTYDDDAGSSESTSSVISPLYTPASAKSLSVQSGAGAVQDVSTDDATQRGQSSANPRPPNGRVRMSLDKPTVATSPVSVMEPSSVNLFIQVETAEDASVFDETSIGSETVEYSEVPKDMLLKEIFDQLHSDCQLLANMTRFGPASGFFEMVYRGDSWVDAGRGLVSLQLPVGSFEYSMQGVPSGRVQLLFRATPFRLKKAAVSVPVFRNKKLSPAASEELRRMIDAPNISATPLPVAAPELVFRKESSETASAPEPEPEPESVTEELVSEMFSTSSFVAKASAFDVEHASKIELKDDWSESPVLLEERGVRVAGRRISGDEKSKRLFPAKTQDVAAAPAAKSARGHVKGRSPSPMERQSATINIEHVPGGGNDRANALSRSTIDLFPADVDGNDLQSSSSESSGDEFSDESSESEEDVPSSGMLSAGVVTVVTHPVVHDLEKSGRAREHCVFLDTSKKKTFQDQAKKKYMAVQAALRPGDDFIEPDETIDSQGMIWALATTHRSEVTGVTNSAFPTFQVQCPAHQQGSKEFLNKLLRDAAAMLQMFGLSTVTADSITLDDKSFQHDRLYVVHKFNPGGGSAQHVVLHLGVSLSRAAMLSIQTPFIDPDGQEFNMCFVPYKQMDHLSRSILAIRDTHFWNRMDIFPTTEQALKELRFRCRSDAVAVPGHSVRSTAGADVSVMSHGDIDPNAAKTMKVKDFIEYVSKMLAQHGEEAKFTGDACEDRTIWKALLVDVFSGPMPMGLPKYVLVDIFLQTLVDGKGHDKKEPKKWFQAYLTKHQQRAVSFGKTPELSLNGSMAAEKRVDVLNDMIEALEKSFPVTDLTGAMIRGMKKLDLKCLSELDEHFEAIYNYLVKIYEAEVQDPHYTKLPGHFENYDLAKWVMSHFGSISKKMDQHLKLVKDTSGYHTDPIFAEIWRVLSSNGVKNRGGVFDAVVQAKYRRVEVYEYQNREGEPVKQAMPGQFKWESTPGRWLLNVIYEFFTEPNDSLADEKYKDWYSYLHKMRTVQEGVEWLTSDSEKDKGADSKKKKKKKNKNKKSKDDADESDDDAKGGTEIHALADLSKEERETVDAGKAQYEKRKSRLMKELDKEQGSFRFHFYRSGEWHRKCSKANKDAIIKNEGSGCVICGSDDHNMFKSGSCEHHQTIIKCWKRDPQADSERKGRADLDDTSKDTDAEGQGKGKGKGKGKKSKKQALPMEKCSVPVNALDSEGSLSDRSSGTACKVNAYKDKMVGEVVLAGEGTRFLCGLETSPGIPTQRQVNVLAKERGIDIVFDPDVRLDSDEPGYKGGHFRLNSSDPFC